MKVERWAWVRLTDADQQPFDFLLCSKSGRPAEAIAEDFVLANTHLFGEACQTVIVAIPFYWLAERVFRVANRWYRQRAGQYCLPGLYVK